MKKAKKKTQNVVYVPRVGLVDADRLYFGLNKFINNTNYSGIQTLSKNHKFKFVSIECKPMHSIARSKKTGSKN
jgi:hypothetical protein